MLYNLVTHQKTAEPKLYKNVLIQGYLPTLYFIYFNCEQKLATYNI